jgi:branched-chain amino acid transport system substrate-binding protein
MQRRSAFLLPFAACLAAVSPAVWAQAKEIRIAHVYSKTGPLEAYGKQTHTGLMMGLDYATGGTMAVATARSSW